MVVHTQPRNAAAYIILVGAIMRGDHHHRGVVHKTREAARAFTICESDDVLRDFPTQHFVRALPRGDMVFARAEPVSYIITHSRSYRTHDKCV